MARARTTPTIDDEVLRAVKLRAPQSGRGDSEVIEEALRRELGLDFLEQMWQRATLAPQAVRRPRMGRLGRQIIAMPPCRPAVRHWE